VKGNFARNCKIYLLPPLPPPPPLRELFDYTSTPPPPNGQPAAFGCPAGLPRGARDRQLSTAGAGRIEGGVGRVSGLPYPRPAWPRSCLHGSRHPRTRRRRWWSGAQGRTALSSWCWGAIHTSISPTPAPLAPCGSAILACLTTPSSRHAAQTLSTRSPRRPACPPLPCRPARSQAACPCLAPGRAAAAGATAAAEAASRLCRRFSFRAAKAAARERSCEVGPGLPPHWPAPGLAPVPGRNCNCARGLHDSRLADEQRLGPGPSPPPLRGVPRTDSRADPRASVAWAGGCQQPMIRPLSNISSPHRKWGPEGRNGVPKRN
jgi:hypothetical protein